MFNAVRKSLAVALAVGAVLSPAIAAPPGYANTGYCYGPDDGGRAPFRVFRYPSRPPLSNAAVAYKYYPLTDSASSQASIINAGSTTNVRRTYFMWANLCDAAPNNSCFRHPANAESYSFGNPPAMPQYPDPITHQHVLFKMTSWERANNCTLAQAAFALSYDDAKVDGYAQGVGLTLVRDRSDLGKWSMNSDHMFEDVCVLPDARLSGAVKGVMLDYEVHDGRSPRVARDFLVAFAKLVHDKGREAILYTNPLDAPIERVSGLDASNLNEVQAAFDMTTILLFRRSDADDFGQEFARQLALLRGPRPVRPPVITFDLARSTMADTQQTRNLLLQNHLPAVIVFQKTAVLEGDCSTEPNRKLRCLIDGVCEG
jgi:hypothetical protein